MSQIVIGVVVAVISAFVIKLLGIGNTKTVVSIQGGKRATTGWKVLIVIGWLMFVGGGYYWIAWGCTNGFGSPHAIIGLTVFFYGAIILGVGKFGAWWNRN